MRWLVLFICLVGNAWAAEVRLAWNPNTEPDLAGYRIHYGTASGSYTSHVDVGNVTACTVPGLEDETRYYFAATAYNATFESGYSNEVNWASGETTPYIGATALTASRYQVGENTMPTWGPTEIQANADDCWEDYNTTSVELSGTFGDGVSYLGGSTSPYEWIGLRWTPDLNSGGAVTIVSATLTLGYEALYISDGFQFRVWGVQAENAPQWSNSDRPRASTKTTAYVDKTVNTSDSSVVIDVTDIVTELNSDYPSNYDGATGMAFALNKLNQPDNSIAVYDFYHSTGTPCRLTIEWTAGGGASAVPANRGNVGMMLGMSNAMWLDNDFIKPLGGN